MATMVEEKTSTRRKWRPFGAGQAQRYRGKTWKKKVCLECGELDYLDNAGRCVVHSAVPDGWEQQQAPAWVADKFSRRRTHQLEPGSAERAYNG